MPVLLLLHLNMKEKTNNPTFYNRNLPHFTPEEGVFFITACLKGALPKYIRKELKDDGLSFEQTRLEKYIGNEKSPQWLKEPAIGKVVKNTLHHFDNDRYKLICYCIMSNHVHFVIYKLKLPLSKIMHSIKSYSANKANKILDRSGAFWQDESFDRSIRHRGELAEIINYCLENPIKAGLVKDWKDWPHTYLKEGFEKFIFEK